MQIVKEKCFDVGIELQQDRKQSSSVMVPQMIISFSNPSSSGADVLIIFF